MSNGPTIFRLPRHCHCDEDDHRHLVDLLVAAADVSGPTQCDYSRTQALAEALLCRLEYTRQVGDLAINLAIALETLMTGLIQLLDNTEAGAAARAVNERLAGSGGSPTGRICALVDTAVDECIADSADRAEITARAGAALMVGRGLAVDHDDRSKALPTEHWVHSLMAALSALGGLAKARNAALVAERRSQPRPTAAAPDTVQ